jgi:CRP-like cAMP-binding protein
MPRKTIPDLRRNRLLAALPAPDLARLQPQLEFVQVQPHEYVQHAAEPVAFVYFPIGGVFSLTTSLPDGVSVEAATVGDEGLVGIEAFLADRPIATGDALLQVPEGRAYRLATAPFRDALASSPAMTRVVGRYATLALAHIIHNAACNARHPVQERCAKWLLLTHDRMHSDEFRLSHEVLSIMLAAGRPTVSVVARTFQQAGLIRYRYTRVTVVDRAGLEEAACGCYRLIRDQFGAAALAEPRPLSASRQSRPRRAR